MPKRDDLVPATRETFNDMRLAAILTAPTAPIRQEVREETWAHFGRAVYANMHSDRFRKAIMVALCAADGAKEPQEVLILKLRTFLLTGTIA